MGNMKTDSKETKTEGDLKNRLQATRTRLGLSQRELAAAAGITRQTIGGIEAELYAPSASVALRLAKALGCRVEDLFWLEDDLPTVQAKLVLPALPEGAGEESGAGESAFTADSINPAAKGANLPLRVTLAQIGGKWIAHPLQNAQAFRTELIPADGLADFQTDVAAHGLAQNGSDSVAARLLDEPDALMRTVLLAGCAPALSLWARSAERWHPGLRVHWHHANSTLALESLARGEIHAAGVHLCDLRGGHDNAPFARQALKQGALVLVNLGVWEEGLLVRPGNPKRLQAGADLAQAGIRIVNREPGAGSRLLLDSWLQSEHIETAQVEGYGQTAMGHLEVAQAVQAGNVDAGISAESVAAIYGLGFVPLRSVRYDLALRKETLDYEPVQQLLGTLRHRWIQSQLRALGGYDTTHTGDIIEVQ